MDELIKVTTNEDNEQLVSARDLYRALEVKKKKIFCVVGTKLAITD